MSIAEVDIDIDDFITIEEAAKMLDVSKRTIHKYLREQVFKKYRLGSEGTRGIVRLRKSEIVQSFKPV